MFSLQPSQMHRLQQRAEEELVGKFVQQLRRTLASWLGDMTDVELRVRCIRAIAQARAHGLHTEFNLFTFVATGLVLGEGFVREAWAREVLQDAHLAEDHKVGLMRLWLVLEHRLDVVANG